MTQTQWKAGDEAMWNHSGPYRIVAVDGQQAWIKPPTDADRSGTLVRLYELGPLPPKPKTPQSGKVWVWFDNGHLQARVNPPYCDRLELDIGQYLRNQQIVESLREGWYQSRHPTQHWWSKGTIQTAPKNTFDEATTEMLSLREQMKGGQEK